MRAGYSTSAQAPFVSFRRQFGGRLRDIADMTSGLTSSRKRSAKPSSAGGGARATLARNTIIPPPRSAAGGSSAAHDLLQIFRRKRKPRPALRTAVDRRADVVAARQTTPAAPSQVTLQLGVITKNLRHSLGADHHRDAPKDRENGREPIHSLPAGWLVPPSIDKRLIRRPLHTSIRTIAPVTFSLGPKASASCRSTGTPFRWPRIRSPPPTRFSQQIVTC